MIAVCNTSFFVIIVVFFNSIFLYFNRLTLRHTGAFNSLQYCFFITYCWRPYFDLFPCWSLGIYIDVVLSNVHLHIYFKRKVVSLAIFISFAVLFAYLFLHSSRHTEHRRSQGKKRFLINFMVRYLNDLIQISILVTMMIITAKKFSDYVEIIYQVKYRTSQIQLSLL